MRGVIIAGGMGTRLRPLTLRRPKPLIRVANRPFLEYQVAQLHAAGADEVVFATNYMAEAIEAHFGDGSAFGVRMRYAVESEPLGTAGAIRNAVEGLPPDRCIVFNGDILTDFDIGAIAKSHQERGAKATLTLKKVQRPHPYGVISVDDDFKVLSFDEPTDEQKRAADRGEKQHGFDYINAGIYILEPDLIAQIPLRKCSIEREFYPQALSQGVLIVGYPGEGYWLDIGRPAQYVAATRALLSNEVKAALSPAGQLENGVWRGKDETIAPDARIDTGCCLGDGCKIGSGTTLDRYTVLGSNCRIGTNCRLSGAILGDRVKVADGSILENCIVDDGCAIGEHTTAANVVLAADSRIEAHSALGI